MFYSGGTAGTSSNNQLISSGWATSELILNIQPQAIVCLVHYDNLHFIVQPCVAELDGLWTFKLKDLFIHRHPLHNQMQTR